MAVKSCSSNCCIQRKRNITAEISEACVAVRKNLWLVCVKASVKWILFFVGEGRVNLDKIRSG